MKVKDETHHGRVKADEPKEEPATTFRCPFGDMRPPFMKIRFYNVGGSTPSTSGGNNLLAGNKRGEDPEFIYGHTITLARHSIVQPNRVINGHGPHFNIDSTLRTAYGRMNQHGVGH